MSGIKYLLVYLALGSVGGYIGARLKIPAGAMIGAMIVVIGFKIATKVDWALPRGFPFFLQIMLGITIGASFRMEMIQALTKVAVPVILSTLILVLVGMILAFIFARMGILDGGTAYLGTSPGAMSPLIVLALESGKDPTIITCFHFFRVVFIILTMPAIYRFFFE
ncbi:AbrB family transcriptional regulator [Thermodesulforhabdus norvegica]|uniref:AbrB family transcriptional regulator n=1 Tax=Thermodesulforhabdus norvegica TaxID=39841 RepID=A0A1I4QFK0_9BACT|nr:AbrB family transcriptional regulator [Thermodesulforhabdus norvegica]SFM38902.1 hypothetical protein SAMN05660836_00014 [Thermodesulforhabdus norvegica]